MKKLKITIAINSLVATRYLAYSNHIQLFFRLGRNHPNIDFILVNPERMTIDRMRTMAADVALDTESDYLCFIDDDVLVPFNKDGYGRDWLDKLINANADLVAGDVIIRGYPFNHMLFRWDKSKSGMLQMPRVPKRRGVIPVDAVGFSLALIKVSLLKRLSKPYFITGPNHTEDIYFCLKAQQEYKRVKIKADTSIVCAHMLWDEVISSVNKKDFKRYYEAQNPQLLEDAKDKSKGGHWRGLNYLKVVQGIVDADTKKKKTA